MVRAEHFASFKVVVESFDPEDPSIYLVIFEKEEYIVYIVFNFLKSAALMFDYSSLLALLYWTFLAII